TESFQPLVPETSKSAPKDSFHFAYIVYYTLGAGYLLPWNAFITAVDYFAYLYPDASVDRVFSVVYMLVGMVSVATTIAFVHKSNSFWRINLGYVLFLVALLAVPLTDFFYVKGRVGIYGGYYLTVAITGLCGLADGLVQGGVVGKAGELPERYMQAVFAGTAASGVLVSALRIFTKAVYPQDADGLRQSANLYFIISIVVMFINIIFYNVAHRLPVIQYYTDRKKEAVSEEKEEKGELIGKLWNSTLWEIVGTLKWYGFGISIIYVVTLSIFPGSITEDVHSAYLGDWYPVVLMAGFNLFDLIGKSVTAVYIVRSPGVAIGGSFARLLFLPLFYICLHGPYVLGTEIPITILCCLLGLTNGYFTSVIMVLAPKTVQLQHAEAAGIVLVLYLVAGLAIGSVVSWFWIL
ncbi:equilibrative nucleoside transporter 1, partial [Genlisea aurea]